MSQEKDLSNTIRKLARINNHPDLGYDEKLQRLLLEMVQYMETEKGSIMTLSGRKHLMVRASTDQQLIGTQEPISGDSPSAWVYNNKKMLSVDRKNPYPERAFVRKQYKKNAFLVAPILYGQEVLGVIAVTEKKGKDTFAAGERDALLDLAGQLIGALETHRLAESLKKKKQLLLKKNRQLKKLEALRKELFNMLIHDLKGPLSNIVANIDILSYVAGDEIMEYVAAAQAGCDTLFRMTSDLLDIARLEEGSMPLLKETIPADTLLSEAVSRIHTIAAVRGIKIEIMEPDRAGKHSVEADRGQMLRVLQNLIVNAMHHSKSGMRITIGACPETEKRVRFFVRDQGPGIEKKMQSAIFDKFFQVEKKRDGRVYSTGLGLTFCKLAVEAHGGEICVDSDGKKGSCFSFVLPEKKK